MKRKYLTMLWAGLLAVLLSCGGEVLTAGGVGSGGSGTAIGPVTGFGSIIVGGVAYDDTGSSTVEQDATGGTLSTTAPLGAQVTLTLGSNGAAKTIELRPSLMGPVSRTLDGNGDLFEVLGQKVRLITTTDAYNTATVVEGYDIDGDGASRARPAPQDDVVVHGVWLNEGSPNAPQYVLQATRLEKRATGQSATAYLLSGQIVGMVPGQAGVVRINELNGVTVNLNAVAGEGKNAVLGTRLTMWVASSAWNKVGLNWNAQPLNALRARPLIPSPSAGERLTLSGRVDAVNPETRTIVVHGVTTTVPVNTPLPQKGQEVQIELEGDDQANWKSGQVQVRTEPQDDTDPKDNLGESVSLRGNLPNPNWQQGRPFLVELRGVRVQIDIATQIMDCTSYAAGTLVQIQLKASRPQRGAGKQITARTVTCAAPRQ